MNKPRELGQIFADGLDTAIESTQGRYVPKTKGRCRFTDIKISNGRNVWMVTGYFDPPGNICLKRIHGDINDTQGIKEALGQRFNLVL